MHREPGSPLVETSRDRPYRTDPDETETQGGQAMLQASSADPTSMAGFARLHGCPLCLAHCTPLIPLSGRIVFYFCIFLYTCAHSLATSSTQHTHPKLVLGGRQMLKDLKDENTM